MTETNMAWVGYPHDLSVSGLVVMRGSSSPCDIAAWGALCSTTGKRNRCQQATHVNTSVLECPQVQVKGLT